MSRSDIDQMEGVMAAKGREIRHDLWQTVLSGVAITVPFFITLLVLTWAVNMILNALSPLVSSLITFGLVEGTSILLVEGIAAALVLGIIFLVGLAAQHGPNTNLGRRIDVLMEDIPGIGTIFTSVERMSDVLLDGDSDSFREVKLVEFPRQGSYSIAFLTAESPSEIEDAVADEEMVTVFVPLAPNPVMGGHLLNLPQDRVYDLDLSVEEGMEAIMTTGMTIDEHTPKKTA